MFLKESYFKSYEILVAKKLAKKTSADFGIIFMPIVGIGKGERRKTGALQWMKGHYEAPIRNDLMGKNLFTNPTLAKATVISEIDSQVQFPNKKNKEKFTRIQTHLFSPKKTSSLLAVFFFPFLRFASYRVLPRTSSLENQHHERISAGFS